MKRRLFYVGTFSDYWVSDNYRETGFRKFFEVETYDYRTVGRVDSLKMYDELCNAINKFSPDIIFINKGELIQPFLIERIKRIHNDSFIVIFNGDQRGAAQFNTAMLGRYCDCVLVNNRHKAQWDEYYDYGVNNVCEYHTATDVDVFHEIKLPIEYDVVFVGGNYGNKFPLSSFRSYCLRKLAKEFRVAVAGGRMWKMFDSIQYLGTAYGAMFPHVIAKSKCVLGISAYNNIYNYTSNRTWNSMACGKPFVCHRFDGCENLFSNMKNIILFDNVVDLVNKVEWVVNNEVEAGRIARAGKELVSNFHTYGERALQLLNIYEKWRYEKDKKKN